MATIVRGRVPAEEFALDHALDALPDIEFEVERIVDSGTSSVMPLVWVRGAPRDALEEVLGADQTVRDVSILAGFDGEFLCRMEWVDHIQLVMQMLTSAEATILNAIGTDGYWTLRVLYPTRDQLSATHEFCETHGLTMEIHSIRDLEGDVAGRYAMTTEQHETLVLAANTGYFKVPREVSLEELAEKCDISHQAISERIRRGIDALVEDTLLIGVDPDLDDE